MTSRLPGILEDAENELPEVFRGLLHRLVEHFNVAAVARANKTVRVAWALLAHKRHYDATYEAMS